MVGVNQPKKITIVNSDNNRSQQKSDGEFEIVMVVHQLKFTQTKHENYVELTVNNY